MSKIWGVGGISPEAYWGLVRNKGIHYIGVIQG